MHLIKYHCAMFKCQYCDYKTFLYCDLITHLNLFHNNDKYKCNSCSFKSKSEHEIEDHVLFHLVNDLFNMYKPRMRPYQCPDPKCGHTAKHLGDIKSHFKNHLGNASFVHLALNLKDQ